MYRYSKTKLSISSALSVSPPLNKHCWKTLRYRLRVKTAKGPCWNLGTLFCSHRDHLLTLLFYSGQYHCRFNENKSKISHLLVCCTWNWRCWSITLHPASIVVGGMMEFINPSNNYDIHNDTLKGAGVGQKIQKRTHIDQNTTPFAAFSGNLFLSFLHRLILSRLSLPY